MDKLPVETICEILQRSDYGTTIRLRRTNKLFQAASVKAEDASWAQFAKSWGGDDVLQSSISTRGKPRSKIYSHLKGLQYLELDLDEEQYNPIIANRLAQSNGSLSPFCLYSKEPITTTTSASSSSHDETRPTSAAIRQTIAQAFPGNYKQQFLDGLETKDWTFMLSYLRGLAQSGGAYGRDLAPEAAYPNVLQFLSVLFGPLGSSGDSEADLLKAAESCTWFVIPAGFIWEHGPKSFARVYWDEFFGVVFPDNQRIIWIESTDTD